MSPLFSIITVTRNAEKTLPATLESILAQTCTLYEVILQDGNSTDSTVSLASTSGIENLHIVSEKDLGIYDAMNKAIDRAKGDYLIFLNAGDRFHSPGTLELLAKEVMDNDYPGIVYGQTDIVDLQGDYIGPRHLTAPETLDRRSFSDGMLVCHQAFVVLRKIAPHYDLRYRLSADYDWCIRAIEASRRNYYVDAVLVDYLNEGMTTRNHRRSLWERFCIMCRYYGTLPTIFRHIRFLKRHLQRK